MARATKRRKAPGRNKKVLDFLNDVSGNQDDDDKSHATNDEQNMQAESINNDDAEDDHVDQRQTRRSARLNKGKAREVAPVDEKNDRRSPESPMFMPQDLNNDAEYNEPVDEEADEAEEAEEGEAEREAEDDGESLGSEEDRSMSDHEHQLQQEQEQAMVAGPSSPIAVVIYGEKVKMRNGNASKSRATETASTPSEAEHIDNSADIDDIEEAEPQEEEENSNGDISDDNSNTDELEDEMGTAMRNLFDWDDEQPPEPEPVQRRRLVDRLQSQPPQASEPSSRKRKRASNTSAYEPESSRRRIEPRNPIVEITVSGALPAASGSTEIADWEAGVSEDEGQNEVIPVAANTTYDEATKIQDLQRSWKRLMEHCQELKATESSEMPHYGRLEAIEKRMSDLLKDYKRIQRKRSRGRAVDPDAWKHTKQEVEFLSKDADKIRKVVQRRAEEGNEKNDFEIQAHVVEYAKLIYQRLMTGLSELALECLKTYYSEEDEWLLTGGFTAVLDILDIAGRLNTTLTSLHNCGMVVLSPDPGRHIRIELRIIQQSLVDAEAYEKRRGR